MVSDDHRRAAAHVVRSERLKQAIWADEVSAEMIFLILRDGDACALCRLPLGERTGNPRHQTDSWNIVRPSVDHVIPKSHGGSRRMQNLRLTHAGCNSARGDANCPQCAGDVAICVTAMQRRGLRARAGRLLSRKPLRQQKRTDWRFVSDGRPNIFHLSE